MWFDVKAAKAKLEAAPKRQEALPCSTSSTSSTPPKGEIPKLKPATRRAGGRLVRLPDAPPICAICGKAEWIVSLTIPDTRTLHVHCWKGVKDK